ncbi:IS1 family transposase, partial [Shigella flexneri]
WATSLRQKQKKLIMLPSETMIWQPEFTDKTLSRKPGAVQSLSFSKSVELHDKVIGHYLNIKHYQ